MLEIFEIFTRWFKFEVDPLSVKIVVVNFIGLERLD